MEVQDAIPANAALMHRAGVPVSINSDDAELGRRLNTEAAKAVKYGGLSELEALALVTINPARQLRIDRRTGLLEPGKDADFVIWAAIPGRTIRVPSRPGSMGAAISISTATAACAPQPRASACGWWHWRCERHRRHAAICRIRRTTPAARGR